ncbi:MAG: hypothetical protein A3H69_00720 [Candidatus Sungbacteria bacterium RIFCSPLOWO2_02_FULL_47_9]|uniref:Dipeptidylpeptidase IV N-terminal domain-containing protein n=1 Tax=Candidatus Sungbacteria bacterium RIFCSPHIGHO2_01_FULL_47_32 TaxID=1802264 RepID=A0A1G2K3L3_9BACT|nr:MAG: hypothetical protein UX72_C0021G0029 [Parcubacteria group bacterium GW2011_GWA2_47_10]OGZ93763.1 MAG: hypothetical protein A2633_02755 [Candidatus Sungbacteria bacterium RIFCSPHIGHO2_01_FULL_47_32]OHA05136.1 MAG: hypothetical protein A3A28_00750 [Candidatus Sungbacteria bacterium RIFCSPLOWO2_01_FULL_47_32]OHA08468.1 MAG: hypothetical protein A3H69_00720 [Candidatus Sungbacteria bacterium RIFCSPLOWO2_02_FULL_47_9]
MEKKPLTIIIAAGVLLLVLIVLLIYMFSGGSKTGGEEPGFFESLFPQGGVRPGGALPTPPEKSDQGEMATGTPEAERAELKKEGKLIQVIKKPVVSPAISQDASRILFFDKQTGNAESVAIDGTNAQKISSTTILGILEALWREPKKDNYVLSYVESDSLKRFIGKTSTSGVIFLPSGITSSQWSPDGNQLAYLLPLAGKTNLVVTDENAKSPKILYSTPIPDFILFWASKNKILLVSRPSGVAPGILFGFDTQTRRADALVADSNGLTILPSPKGTSLLFAKTNSSGKDLKLFVSGIDGKNQKELQYPTLPEKCAFAADNVTFFCAVPKNIGSFAVLPDDWYMGNEFFNDTFYKISATSTVMQEILPTGSFDAINLFTSPDRKYLFFQDKQDGTVWRLVL